MNPGMIQYVKWLLMSLCYLYSFVGRKMSDGQSIHENPPLKWSPAKKGALLCWECINSWSLCPTHWFWKVNNGTQKMSTIFSAHEFSQLRGLVLWSRLQQQHFCARDNAFRKFDILVRITKCNPINYGFLHYTPAINCTELCQKSTWKLGETRNFANSSFAKSIQSKTN